MRAARYFMFLLILEGLCFASTIAVTPGTGGAENDLYNGNTTLGWVFTLSSPVTVTALGYFDAKGSAGLADSYPVGIFNSTGALLVSATVPSGPPTSLLDGFSFISVAPVVLGAGTYEIGAYASENSTDDFLFDVTGSSSVPQLTLGEPAETFGNALTEPAGLVPSVTQGYFGPDFLVSQVVPEPSSAPFGLALVIFGWLVHIGRRRRSLPSRAGK
jgi:hypothetical protein